MLATSIQSCPHLPNISGILPITYTRKHRGDCGETFYIACHELAQSLWLQGRPAQAILQLDKAMMAKLAPHSETINSYPIPYKAIQWIITHTAQDSFLGNPVRHFQHLASRMNPKQPKPELRTARAWTCLHIAEKVLTSTNFPRDFRQIKKEALNIPNQHESLQLLKMHSPHEDEINLVRDLLSI